MGALVAASKVIFLDMDGVLNSTHFFRSKDDAGLVEYSQSDDFFRGMIDPVAVGVLSEIATKSGAALVLSSSWRNVITLEDLEPMLREAGYRGLGFVGKTDSRGAHRNEEIRRFLIQHPEIKRFLVLDDTKDAHIPGHTILTSPATGLLPTHVRPALNVLGEHSAVAAEHNQ